MARRKAHRSTHRSSPRRPRGARGTAGTQKLVAGVIAAFIALVAGVSPALSGGIWPGNGSGTNTASWQAYSTESGSSSNRAYSAESGSGTASTSSTKSSGDSTSASSSAETLASVPEYTDSLTVFIDADSSHPQGTPSFSAGEIAEAKKGAFTSFGDLDELGRCTAAYACLGPETLSYEPRESIQSVHPTGWHQTEYSFVSGGVLYNRCHLIAHSLCGENANEKNLITGTRAMNTEGMLPFESRVDSYIEDTNNHVLYRVTPVFSGNELVARGVQIEARSLEDDGTGLSLNVYCYNVQPGVEIDYATGKNHAS